MFKEHSVTRFGQLAAIGLLLFASYCAPLSTVATAHAEDQPIGDVCTILPSGEKICVPAGSFTPTELGSDVQSAPSQNCHLGIGR